MRQLRTAVTSGSSPQAVAQAQLLERENVRLRAEAQFLRARLSSIDTSPPLLPTISSSSVPSSSLFTPASAFGSSQNRNEYSLRLPSVSDTMVSTYSCLVSVDDRLMLVLCFQGQSNSSSSSSASSTYAGQQRSYASSMDNSNGARGYESAAEYRRRVTSPYSLDYSSTRHSYSQEYPQSTLQQSSSSSVAPLTGSALSPSPYLVCLIFHPGVGSRRANLRILPPCVFQQSSQPAASASSSSTLGEYYEQDYGTGASTYTTYPTNVEEPSPVFPATAAAPVANYPSYASPYLLGGTNYTGSHEDVKPFVQ